MYHLQNQQQLSTAPIHQQQHHGHPHPVHGPSRLALQTNRMQQIPLHFQQPAVQRQEQPVLYSGYPLSQYEQQKMLHGNPQNIPRVHDVPKQGAMSSGSPTKVDLHHGALNQHTVRTSYTMAQNESPTRLLQDHRLIAGSPERRPIMKRQSHEMLNQYQDQIMCTAPPQQNYALQKTAHLTSSASPTSPSEMVAHPKEYQKNENVSTQYKKIFVGGLPHNLELEQFRSYFLQFGHLEDCVIVKEKRTQKPRGFGFITYSDIRSVSKVIDMRNNHFIDGKWVDCKSAIPFEEIKLIEKQQKEESNKSTIPVQQTPPAPSQQPPPLQRNLEAKPESSSIQRQLNNSAPQLSHAHSLPLVDDYQSICSQQVLPMTKMSSNIQISSDLLPIENARSGNLEAGSPQFENGHGRSPTGKMQEPSLAKQDSVSQEVDNYILKRFAPQVAAPTLLNSSLSELENHQMLQMQAEALNQQNSNLDLHQEQYQKIMIDSQTNNIPGQFDQANSKQPNDALVNGQAAGFPDDPNQQRNMGLQMMMHQLHMPNLTQRQTLHSQCNTLIQHEYHMEAKDDERYYSRMGSNERNAKENVDRHIDKLNYDYMTDEEKNDMNRSATTTLPWSHNPYQNASSSQSFNQSIWDGQKKLEDYQSFNSSGKSVDWSTSSQELLDGRESKNMSITLVSNKSIYSGFLTSINEQYIDQFDHSDHKRNKRVQQINYEGYFGSIRRYSCSPRQEIFGMDMGPFFPSQEMINSNVDVFDQQAGGTLSIFGR